MGIGEKNEPREERQGSLSTGSSCPYVMTTVGAREGKIGGGFFGSEFVV
jgi:hypothetical protein